MPNGRRRASIKDTFLRLLCRRQYSLEDFSSAAIRSTISSTPLLPSISRLSLLPDFTSIQRHSYNLEANPPAATANRPKPADLLVQYSLLTTEDNLRRGRGSRGYPSLRKIAGQDSLKAPTRGRSAEYNKNNGPVLERQPTYFKPETVRSDANSRKEYNQSSFRMRALAQVASNTPIRDAAQGSLNSRSNTPIDDSAQVLPDSKHRPHHLVGSFCIVDLQLPGYPVSVVSSDLLPEEELQDDEALFLEEQFIGKSGQICVNESSLGFTYHLLVKGDLIECSTQLATYRFIAQVNITELAIPTPPKHPENPFEDTETDEDDVWMIIARESMEASRRWQMPGSSKLDQPDLPAVAKSSKQPDLESRADVAMVRQSYECCFIISASTPAAQDYDITHVSRSIVSRLPQHKTLRARYPGSADDIISLLAKGERCTTKLNDRIAGQNGSLCCNPMFGPDLNCWLCFFFP